MTTKKTKTNKAATESPEIKEPIVEPTREIAQATDQAADVNAVLAGGDTEATLSNKKRKTGKTKVIRDSFSFPEQDYRKISELKKACLAAGVHAKKGEILRAGLHLLSKMEINELTQVLGQVEKVQTGRPSAAKV